MNNRREPSPWEALEIAWDLLLSIAVPIVLFGFGGRWLDERYDRTPIFTIIGLILAFTVMARIVYKKGKDIADRL